MSSPKLDSVPRRLVQGGARDAEERGAAALLAHLRETDVDDDAIARVRRRVLVPTGRSHSAPVFAAISAVAMVAALALWASRGPSGSPRPAQVTMALANGHVQTHVPSRDWEPGQTGASLSPSSTVKTDATGRALVRIAGVSGVLVAEASDVTFAQPEHGTQLRLDHGGVSLRVTKRPAGEPLVVRAGRFEVEVVGTIFTVEHPSDDAVRVSVREGLVRVRDGQEVVAMVAAGQRWSSDGAQADDHTPASLVTALEDTLAGRDASRLGADLSALPSPLAESRDPAPPRDDSPPAATSHGAMLAPLPHASLLRSESMLPSASGIRATPAVIEPSVPQAPETTAAPALARATAVPAPIEATEDPYARGVTLEAEGDLPGAARELERATTGSHADLALYSLGRLAQRRLHDRARALAAYRHYRAAFPAGSLIHEVDFAILSLLAEGHDVPGAVAEAGAFLAHHPSSERAEEVRRLRAQLLRDSDQCTAALNDYASLRNGRFADDAVYSTAYCQRRLGDRAGASATLGEYVRRFPNGAHKAEAVRAIESGHDTEN